MSLRRNTKDQQAAELRRLRETVGLSREDLGEQTGYSAKQIGRWERGELRVREAVLQYLLNLQPPLQPTQVSTFTFVDLFAGIGGFRKGFESAGGRCVFTSEWDKYAQMTYKANFGDHEVFGDITEIAATDIPDHDVLLAGFPCQPFSIAGVSKKNSLGRKHGFECETQGTLFFDIERIIKAKQPKAFVLENVKNLASHDGGRTFEVIRRTLQQKLGYRLTWKVIDARVFVPQHRERVFIVGVRSDLDAVFDWNTVQVPPSDAAPKLGSILHAEDGTEANEERFLDPRGKVLPKYTLTDHLWQYLQEYAAKHQAQGNGFGVGLVGPQDVARTLSARY
jgi:DNA (cytosine-5)-methyltransferase 1